MAATPLTKLALEARKVLVRCDFNVPLDAGRITDATRIEASLETIRYILSHDGAAVLCSHLGRPKERTLDLSLKPIAEHLGIALGKKVALAPDCIGDITGRMIMDLAPGNALLLENLRFHPEEEANDARVLAEDRRLRTGCCRPEQPDVADRRRIAKQVGGELDEVLNVEVLDWLAHSPRRRSNRPR